MEEIRVGFAKLGNIGTSAMLDLMLDERAEREDIDFRVVSSGPKMREKDGKEIIEKLLEFDPDLIIIASPNPATPGPTAAREAARDVDIPVIVIGDAPGTRISDDLEQAGFGYIFVMADAMIGARREFLDPVEMSIFNSDLIKVLSITGAFRVVREEIDNTISKLGSGETYIPQTVVDRDEAVNKSEFENPYAKTKAMAAFEIASKVADVDVEGCFQVHEESKYVPIVASAHEMMGAAAKLADEARMLEKGEDAVLRTPHADDGKLLRKRKLMESFK